MKYRGKKLFQAVAAGAVLLLPLSACSEDQSAPPAANSTERTIRPPAVAGGFYPSSTEKLTGMIRGYLKEADFRNFRGRIVAMIAPHAGYPYSGKTAAAAFKELDDQKVKTVILIGSSHRAYFSGISVYGGDGYRTPLGTVEVDRVLADRLRQSDKNISYKPGAHNREHSLEVEIPFLQVLKNDFRIVPILIGRARGETVRKLGDLLGAILKGDPEAVIVCSTDMTHYPPYEAACRIDRETLEAIETMDPEEVIKVRRKYIPGSVPNLSCTLCGEEAVIATMIAARRAGTDRVEILGYSNSGDVSFGDKNRVVGYGAVIFLKEDEKMNEEKVNDKKEREGLSSAAQKRLLEITRLALSEAVNGRPLPSDPVDDPELQGHQGAFVTLTENGRLRGCIGQFTAERPLYEVVREMARSASLRDPRFPPVSPDELDGIEIEISVLSPMKKISDPMEEVELGKHGIYIRRGFRSGTYLPQVATDHHMSKEEFLSSCTAHKAGLSPDAWKDPETEVYVYTAEVFGEED